MAKCAKCQQRKAKRPCPALGISLCSLCCGQLRQKDVHCPPGCPFLKKHKPYHEKRILEKKEAAIPRRFSSEEDILNDERMAWLALHVEAPIKTYAEKDASFLDKDALLALEYAKEKIRKGKGLIIIDRQEHKPLNEIGEAIFQSVEQCRYEKQIILPGEFQTYKNDEKVKCLERIILAVKFFAQENFEDRRYIKQLQERFAQIQSIGQKNRILTLK
jgi:hypothetical protein